MICDENITEIEQGTQVISADPDGCDSILQISSIYGCPVEEDVNMTETPSTTDIDFDISSTMNSIDLSDISSTIGTTDKETSTIPTDVTDIDRFEYSLEGKWCKYDANDNEIFGFEVKISDDCSQIQFIMYSPANNTWFGIGIGGNYDDHVSSEEYVSSSEASTTYNEADIMNGYAIISTGTGIHFLPYFPLKENIKTLT